MKLPVLFAWSVVRQLFGRDAAGLGETAVSARSKALEPRTRHADRVLRPAEV